MSGDNEKLTKLGNFFTNPDNTHFEPKPSTLRQAGLPNNFKTTVTYIRARDTLDRKNFQVVTNPRHHQLCVKSIALAEALLKDGLDGIWIYDNRATKWTR